MKKITAVSLLKQKQRQMKNTSKQWNQYFKHWGYINIPYKMLTSYYRTVEKRLKYPRSALVPDTHTEKSDSWLNAFRNYYKKHTRTADLWPFRRLHRSETRHPRLALVPDTHTEKSDSWLNAFRNYYKKHTRTADLWPFQRLHRSETRHPG